METIIKVQSVGFQTQTSNFCERRSSSEDLPLSNDLLGWVRKQQKKSITCHNQFSKSHNLGPVNRIYSIPVLGLLSSLGQTRIRKESSMKKDWVSNQNATWCHLYDLMSLLILVLTPVTFGAHLQQESFHPSNHIRSCLLLEHGIIEGPAHLMFAPLCESGCLLDYCLHLHDLRF